MPVSAICAIIYILGLGNKNGTGSIQFGTDFLATDLLFSRSLIDSHLYGLPAVD